MNHDRAWFIRMNSELIQRTARFRMHRPFPSWLLPRRRFRCEWNFANGERCGCRRRLEYDHIQPLALGGESTVENVRIACRPHNLLAARRIFGNAVMDRYVRGPWKPARPANTPAPPTAPSR